MQGRWPAKKGASGWLTTLPLKVHGFELPKGLIRDTLCLRYEWQVLQLPTTCVCGSAMEEEHALSCQFGGLPIRRHKDQGTEPPGIVPEEGRVRYHHRASTAATFNSNCNLCRPKWTSRRVDWGGGGGGEAFFDIRVFNPFSSSYHSVPIPSTYRSAQERKKVEVVAFTPLVFLEQAAQANWHRQWPFWSDWLHAWQTRAANPTALRWHG